MRTVLIALVFIGLSACDHEPDSTACQDYRVMTFYDNNGMPPTKEAWAQHPRTTAVCVVAERKVQQP